MTAPLGIDVHAHFFPERFIRAIEESGAPSGGSVDRSDPIGPIIVTKGQRTAPLEARYWDLGKRVTSMNRQGVQVQALSLTAPMVYWAEGELGARLAREWNDGASAAHTAHPDRFVVCATLPMQDAARSLAELDRAAKLPGVRAVYMGTNVNGRNLSDPAFFSVFERCQALGLPIGLHPFNVNGAERLRPYYLTNLLGNPYDTGIAAAHLIFGGVLDRLPKLQVILPHAGGTFPLVWGRLQRGQKVRPEANRAAKKSVKAYLRRFTYDTISHDPGALRYLIATVGADRVMLGTDFCFDMGYEKPLDIIRDTAVKLSRADQAKVVRENAARLLRLR
ncbi:MAG TPA: amidohydrolase family protein [Candidatus Bathyarchaeia archaeon]|nr:amidohydrolase family protein [Candidatus Bathyarchaeia archaeon]